MRLRCVFNLLGEMTSKLTDESVDKTNVKVPRKPKVEKEIVKPT